MFNLNFPVFLFLMAVSICTLNVNGIADSLKWEKVFNFLQNSHFDICLLQETHLPDLAIFWRNNGAVTRAGLRALHVRPEWTCLSTPGAQLKSKTFLPTRPAVSLQLLFKKIVARSKF